MYAGRGPILIVVADAEPTRAPVEGLHGCGARVRHYVCCRVAGLLLGGVRAVPLLVVVSGGGAVELVERAVMVPAVVGGECS